jgi:hypothetical protein
MKQPKQPFQLVFFSFLLVCLLTGLTGISRVPEQVQAAPPRQAAVQPHVVISEFRAHGNGADDEFIEIFNATANTVVLNNWLVRKSSGCGTTLADVATINTSLFSGQYYLLAKSAGYTGTADQTYTTTIADDGGIALIDNFGNIVDQVGLCDTTTYKESMALAKLTSDANQSYERKIAGEARNCIDTNNNAADFVLNATSSNPQTSTGPTQPCLIVTDVTSAAADGAYTAASTNIDITVTFSGTVYVTGVPTLQLETGVTDQSATYLSGSGTNTLTFRYTTVAGDFTLDLDYVSANALNGSIYDATGNAILTLPVPGSAGSLGANKAISVNINNNVPPVLVSVQRQNPLINLTNANTLVFRITFNENVTGVDITDFIVHSNAPAATTTAGITGVVAVNGSVYSLTVSGGDLATFSGIVGLDLYPLANIQDQTGNNITIVEPSAANDETYTVDHTNPSVTVNQATGQVDPTGVTPINFTVAFSEPIVASTFTIADITSSGFITWSITNPSGDRRNFTLSAIAITQTSVVVSPTIAAGRVNDDAGNTNQASISTDNSVTFSDTTAPTVTVNQAAGQADPTTTLPVQFTILFSEPIATTTFTLADITLSGTASGVTWTLTDSGDHRTFSLAATAVTIGGTLVPSLSANRVTDVAGNLNLASTSTDNSVSFTIPPTATPTLSPTPTLTRTPTKTRTPTLSRTPTRRATFTAVPLQSLVAISEFVPRPGHDWNNDGQINTGDEYIELINHGSIDVNLNGYKLDDEANIGSSPYGISSVTLKPGERRVFYGSDTGLLLSDGGDGVRLLKPNGQLMDAFNYTIVGYPDQAYCRLPDDGGADDWSDSCYPTPGLRNSRGNFGTVNSTPMPASLCPFSDLAPKDFIFAECDPFGNNIWRPAYWDDPGWLNGQSLPRTNSKWDIFAD